MFAAPPIPGLTEALLGEPIEMVVTHLGDHLHLVTAGQVPPNPSEMMSNARVATFLRALAERYEYVVLDAPPILPVSDSVALARWVDGVLVVVQADRVSRRDVSESLARLERVGRTRLRAGAEPGPTVRDRGRAVRLRIWLRVRLRRRWNRRDPKPRP